MWLKNTKFFYIIARSWEDISDKITLRFSREETLVKLYASTYWNFQRWSLSKAKLFTNWQKQYYKHSHVIIQIFILRTNDAQNDLMTLKKIFFSAFSLLKITSNKLLRATKRLTLDFIKILKERENIALTSANKRLLRDIRYFTPKKKEGEKKADCYLLQKE